MMPRDLQLHDVTPSNVTSSNIGNRKPSAQLGLEQPPFTEFKASKNAFITNPKK